MIYQFCFQKFGQKDTNFLNENFFSAKRGYLKFCFVSLAPSLDSAKKTSDDIIGIIAGSVAGVVILVAAVVAVILICKKCKARERQIGHRNE